MAVLALFILFSLIGYRRGLIKSVLSTVGIVGAMLLSNMLSPYVADLLNNHTGLRPAVKTQIEEALGIKELEEEMSVYEREDYLEKLAIPEIVKNCVRSGNAGAQELQGDITDYTEYVTNYLTDMAMRGIAYLVTVLFMLLIVLIALALSHMMSGIPIVGGIDKWGGVIFGVIQALLIVWVGMLIVTILSPFSWASQTNSLIEDSGILRFLYSKNIFLRIIEKM